LFANAGIRCGMALERNERRSHTPNARRIWVILPPESL
jgi:hypothetical protein